MIEDIHISLGPHPGPRVIRVLDDGRVRDDADQRHLGVVVQVHVDPHASIEGQVALRAERNYFV